MRIWVALSFQLLATACLVGSDPVSDGDSDLSLTAQNTVLKTVDRRFEVVPMDCSAAEEASTPQCPPDDRRCLCSNLFDRLNEPAGSPGNPRGKFVVMLGGARRADVEAAGNVPAYLVNALNRCTGHPAMGDTKPAWKYCNGAQRAQQIMNDANTHWGGEPPKWVLLNELFSTFRKDTQLGQEYRQWIIDVVTALHNDQGRRVVLFTYFRPLDTQWSSEWAQIGQVANVGVEMYLSGQEVSGHGAPVTWSADEYRAWRQRFVANGVPADKVLLAEHFGQTASGKGFGRTEVSDSDWRTILHERTKAEQDADFAGYISYGWSINNVGAAGTPGAVEANRLAYESIYAGFRLAGHSVTLEMPKQGAHVDPATPVDPTPVEDDDRDVLLPPQFE
jgi:hypothetical protein